MTDYLIQHKKTILVSFILTAFISIFLSLGVSINYDIADYLPKESRSTKALDIMNEEFETLVPNGQVMISNSSISNALYFKEELTKINGISSVMWLDDVINILEPIEVADQQIVEEYLKNDNALISITVDKGEESKVLESVYQLIGDENAASGDFVDTATQQMMAVKETTRAMMIAIPIIIIILLLTTSSWMEPVLFLLTIGISVVINMGTNIFFKDISFITQAISPILQLAVSLDYAIFLLGSFEKFRHETDDINQAMSLAIKRSTPTILASSSTTLFGFVALLFMRFRIGADLGIILVKGIVLSFISVIVFLPALTLLSYKIIDKTRHKIIIPQFKNIGKHTIKLKFIVIVVVSLLIFPAFQAQKKNLFLYGMGSELSDSIRSGKDTRKINDEFGYSTPIVLLVPRGNLSYEEKLTSLFEQEQNVTSVISYSSMVDNAIPIDFLDNSITNQFYSENYSRIIINTNTTSEGPEAFKLIEKVNSLTSNYYGDDFYSLGISVNLYDIKSVVENDTPVINTIAIISIALILLVTFKSLLLPILLVLTIETSIWINLSLPYFTGTPLCYIGYLVISTVQLGATVDYAILLTDHYLHNRKTQNKKEAIITTLSESANSIFVSGFILASAGFSLGFISSDQIISELGMLLGRGTLLSMTLVILFLPATLVVFDKLIFKTRFNKNKEVNNV